jgi:cytochrome c553
MKSTLTLMLALLAAPAAFAQAPAAQGAASAPAAAHAAAPAKADAARGQAIATQVCAACHSIDGGRGSPANPILQGQHPDYIVKQLVEFKTDKRKNPVMKGFASALSEADMKNVAAFYAGKQAKPGFAKSKESVALGEKIYRGGLADKDVPACAGCHSPTGAGIPSQFPRLSGQHADYTQAQLVAFRGGARQNNSLMTAVTAKMSDKEIQAVSDYIAGLR